MLQSWEAPDQERKGPEMMLHHDFDFGSSRERAVQMRTEVERNHLKTRLAEARLSKGGAGLEETVLRRGMLARGAAVFMGLLK